MRELKKRWIRQLWTADEEAYLRAHYPDTSTSAIAAHLKRPLGKVYAKATDLGLKKTAEYIRDPKNRCRLLSGANIGRATRFLKGHVPANKGLRRPGYSVGRMRETQFKKGQRSGAAAKNWVPVGTILRDPDGYARIKVREAEYGKEPYGFGNTRVWPMYNRWLWEHHNGPIPPKHLVVFKDGNKQNCVIENLELISMADNARRNAMWRRFPPALIDVVLAKGALNRAINIRSRHAREEHVG